MDEAWVPPADPGGIFLPLRPIEHREQDYDSATFAVLADMQARHFWYLGRHRFLWHALRRTLRCSAGRRSGLQGVDLGGGCGGWLSYLSRRQPNPFGELALADSSVQALTRAAAVVGPNVRRYQIDLLDLRWERRWDVAFLLDVLEHIPDDERVLRQVRQALRPGGMLLVTTPALRAFWTYNDVLAHHVRRYSLGDFSRLADACGLQLCFARYFMFLLSPLLLLSRLRAPDPARMSESEQRAYLARTHRVPSWPVNQALRLIFSLESPAGVWLSFPWGTSVLAVLRRPA
jgi:2-polyprenyl-3-methyl-5-hydroxy-6-metoxy-1,4-benzoquinol methylase